MYKQQLTELEKMNLRHMESSNAQREESEARLRQAQADSDLKERLLAREFALKTDDIIRDYERKIADQREIYESQMDTTKEETGRLVRETERKQKTFIDELSKSYEHKIAQMEQSAKERERSIQAMHQEQIDNIRRKNAAINRSKS